MKLLSVTVPCYNSEAYMRKCIDSLLPGGEEVEIIIVNDGSTDGTQAIAEEYVKKYPSIVRLINKENGGHGSGVNTGLSNATGIYTKVVDSDDWVNQKAYKAILNKLSEFNDSDSNIDMLVSNFVYEKVGEKRKKVMGFHHAMPRNILFTWDDIKHFTQGQYMLMHSVIFRTQLLRDCGLKLPEHTFYVDDLYVFTPLPRVKTIYYLDVNFYRYFIGRPDQSVQESVMIKRIDQQLKVNKTMVDTMAKEKPKTLNKDLRRYMFHYLSVITTISTVMAVVSGTPENLQKNKDLWKYIKDTDPYIYRKLRYSLKGIATNLPGRFGRFVTKVGYKVCQKIFGFN